MNELPARRLKLALPFTILTAPDTVRLVAGEDYRYTLTAPGLQTWLPGVLASLDGRPVADVLRDLPDGRRGEALHWLDRLHGERVLADSGTELAHEPAAHRLEIEGGGPLAAFLRDRGDAANGGADRALRVLCQDTLDFAEALRFNRSCRGGDRPYLWATAGPMTRGFVSPVFLPNAGPCLGCLLRQFQRLSPAPEIHDALLEHSRQGGAMEPVPFPEPGIAVLGQLVLWKAQLLAQAERPAALFRLHVLEVDSLEVSAHRAFADPTCPECGGGR